jgi:hypothetical protein
MTASHPLGRIVVSAWLLSAFATHSTPLGSAASAAMASRPSPVPIELVKDARYRAVFCGREGAETSAIYSQTLARDLNRLEATGRTTAQSLAYIETRACGRS